ncbi:MAG: transglycosylase SLT domain-containing protein [Pseudobdellovibrionaceae bacterium]|nr:transglycosylase SLT domain-containing protein [Bdellovibrionales bacterium]USN46405.1 MAG: transglycosylase SLT domain-containing protein [Pseudobdellovibrionaceae bacterium]
MRFIMGLLLLLFMWNIPPVLSEELESPNDGDTPVMFLDDLENFDINQARQWEAPKYGEQGQAIGYGVDTFKTPEELQERVGFWVDIYAKYTTDQGLLHDSRYVHLIYEVVDFTDIMADAKLSDRAKQRARQNLVKQSKDKIKQRLLKLQAVKDPSGLEGEDLRYWHLFSRVEEENKFKEATTKKRLRFQLGQKDRFYKGIYYSGSYIKEMEQIFREAGLPVELTRLPFVESSFNVKARSKVGASGIWQFMRSTGRRFMRITNAADERNDPLTATRSAARFLKINYDILQDWPLAVTAYNHGPSGIRNLLKKYNASSLVELVDVRKHRFGFASANFYSSFLAALHVEKNADKIFGKAYWAPPLPVQKLALTKNINKQTLVRWFSENVSSAKEFNPQLKSTFWRGWYTLGLKDFVYVPQSSYQVALDEMSKMKDQKSDFTGTRSYRIASGETLSELAQRFGVSVRAIQEVNNIGNARSIRAGQKIIIPEK